MRLDMSGQSAHVADGTARIIEGWLAARWVDGETNVAVSLVEDDPDMIAIRILKPELSEG